MICELLVDDEKSGPPPAALISANMLFVCPESRSAALGCFIDMTRAISCLGLS